MEQIDMSLLNWEVFVGYVTQYGLSIIFALLIFFLGKWIAAHITRLLKHSLTKAKLDPMLVSFLGNLSYALILAFVVVAAISKLGVETTSVAAVFAAAGLAVGLALQGSLSNFAAGVMIVAFRPFRNGDYIEAAGTAGIVHEINIFTTTLKTPDNKTIIIPNASITSSNICNYSAEKTRRIDLVFSCSYTDDLALAKKVLTKVVNSNKLVLKIPESTIAVSELAANSIDFIVRPWVNTNDYWTARFELIEAVKIAFDKEGISIPFPQRDVYLHQTNTTQAKVPKKSKKS
jgi:small conductance mechanosensitive channel